MSLSLSLRLRSLSKTGDVYCLQKPPSFPVTGIPSSTADSQHVICRDPLSSDALRLEVASAEPEFIILETDHSLPQPDSVPTGYSSFCVSYSWIPLSGQWCLVADLLVSGSTLLEDLLPQDLLSRQN